MSRRQPGTRSELPTGAARVLALLMALALLAALAVGCERRQQDAPGAAEPAADLRVSADHGAEMLLDTEVPAGQSVMRALRGATTVRTEYAGGFVAEMLGRSSDATAQRDWFLFVNGMLSPVGARDVALADGDAVWWDHRHWGTLNDPWAVVGSWPAPFTRPADAVLAEPPLDAVLREAGASLVDGGVAGWRVRVGESRAVAARDPAWARALSDPARAGLSAWVEDERIVALDAASGEVAPVEGARALIAAVPAASLPGEGVVVVVAGIDEAAARAAADALAADPELVAGVYALVLDGEGRALRAGGRPGG